MLREWLEAGRIEAGCDEAGRGCLCGPVACAAVILPPDFRHPDLNDSKKLTEKRRRMLREIIEREAVSYAVEMVSAEEIDRINILRASIEGMHRAVDRLTVRPDHLLIDGNRFTPHPGISHTTIVHGDALYMSIAAASILAKTYRDELMEHLALEYPGYGWESNKGYPTADHRRAILRLGLTPHHRRTFGPCSQPSLFDAAESGADR